MNCLKKEAEDLIESIMKSDLSNQVIICPPFTLLQTIGEKIKNSLIKLGAQDCSIIEKNGARTGEVSAKMLKDLHCSYVIIGHSERRECHNESNELIQQKIKSALNQHIIPILCIGETAQEKENGFFREIILSQLKVLENLKAATVFIAYEPISAIGSGKALSLEEISEAIKYISEICKQKFAIKIKILYGGSVNNKNSRDILSLEEVDGVLVGSASLDSNIFIEICKSEG
jgi:triosephosphate isomerase